MKQPILAICYDFDKTLSPDDMQAQGYIQSIDCEIAEFWKQSNQLASDNDMDQNLAYMYMMASKSNYIRKRVEVIHMSTIFTEANYENSVIELFRNDLGYEYVYGPDIERDFF